MNVKTFLIVPFPEGPVCYFLVDGPTSAVRSMNTFESDRYRLLEEAMKNWNRFKTQDRATLLKALTKRFPAVQEVPMVEQDIRLEINRILVADECYVVRWDNRVRASMCQFRNEHNEWSNRDGVPIRLCDNKMVAYPTPPEGMRRYRVSIAFPGASYSDHHKMVMATDARSACLQEKAWLDDPANPFRVNNTAFVGVFDTSKITFATATDVDSEEISFFNGPGFVEDASTRDLSARFNSFR